MSVKDIREDKHGLVMLDILDMDGYEQRNRVYGSGGGIACVNRYELQRPS